MVEPNVSVLRVLGHALPRSGATRPRTRGLPAAGLAAGSSGRDRSGAGNGPFGMTFFALAGFWATETRADEGRVKRPGSPAPWRDRGARVALGTQTAA
jgi:hypothetical protein